jgi:polar amino acid transport system substrate-binding protein
VGTIQVDQLEAQNEECEDEISISTFDLNPMAVEQLRLGRADAVLADYPVAAYDASLSEGELEIGGEPFPPEPYGVGLRKDSAELKAAIEDAIQAIMDSGEYDDILAEWGLEAGSIE